MMDTALLYFNNTFDNWNTLQGKGITDLYGPRTGFYNSIFFFLSLFYYPSFSRMNYIAAFTSHMNEWQ